MQQMAAGQIQTLCHCSEDVASVHGQCTLQTELLWRPHWALNLDFLSSSVTVASVCALSLGIGLPGK